MGSAENCAEQHQIGDKGTEVHLYEEVVVPTALYGAEAGGMRSAG